MNEKQAAMYKALTGVCLAELRRRSSEYRIKKDKNAPLDPEWMIIDAKGDSFRTITPVNDDEDISIVFAKMGPELMRKHCVAYVLTFEGDMTKTTDDDPGDATAIIASIGVDVSGNAVQCYRTAIRGSLGKIEWMDDVTPPVQPFAFAATRPEGTALN